MLELAFDHPKQVLYLGPDARLGFPQTSRITPIRGSVQRRQNGFYVRPELPTETAVRRKLRQLPWTTLHRLNPPDFHLSLGKAVQINRTNSE